MGLFDFDFEAGKNLGMEMNLTQEIQELDIEVENLEVDFNDGVVTECCEFLKGVTPAVFNLFLHWI